VKEKEARLRAIKKIIKTYKIKSQRDLLKHLRENGFNVTQATLSRDMRFLRVNKISDGENGYYYSLPSLDMRIDSEKSFIKDIIRGFISIDYSGNMAIMHTIPGHADSVAFAIDNLSLDEIIGTMAGDDTVLIILKENLEKEEFKKMLKEKIPELEL